MPIKNSSHCLEVHPVTSTLRFSTTEEQAFVPYAEIDDIPFIDDDEDENDLNRSVF
jgi:hypothetical protein